MEGSRLKTAPKGFERDHPEIDLLRYKQFILRHDFTAKEVLSKDFPEKMAVSFNEMRPFLDYMSDILTTDLMESHFFKNAVSRAFGNVN